MILRRLQVARLLGGRALPSAAPCALRVVCEPALPRAAAAQEELSGEGCGRCAPERALGAARGFCAAAASSGDEEPPAPAAAPPQRVSAAARGDADAARSLARAKRAPNVGIKCERTASGRPKPDVRTVARLVELGWWDKAEEAEAMLTRRKVVSRYAFETAGPAIDWLLNTLGEEKHSGGRCLAAQAVYKLPLVLSHSTSLLKRGWEMVTLPREAGGLGLSEEVARRRVATSPQVLRFTKESVQKRAAFLETLGIPDGRAAIAGYLTFLGFTEDKLQGCADWFRSKGLDAKQMVSTQPQLLMLTPQVISPKLEFLRDVVGLSSGEVLPAFLIWSLEARLRPRWFYAVQRGIEQRYTFGTLAGSSDARYTKMVVGLARGTHATVGEVAALRAHIASPAFLAYMDEQERNIRARLAETREQR